MSELRVVAIASEFVLPGSQPEMAEEMLRDPLVQYVFVRDAKAGCYGLRVERREER